MSPQRLAELRKTVTENHESGFTWVLQNATAFELLHEIERLNAVSNDLAHETMDLSAKLSYAREVIRVLSNALNCCTHHDSECPAQTDGDDCECHAESACDALESTREKRERLK